MGGKWAENLKRYIAYWFLVPNFTAKCLCLFYVKFKKSKKVQIIFFTKSISFRSKDLGFKLFLTF